MRIKEIDGIRAISIIAVIVRHSFLISGGFLGVDIFFVISGYLITNILLKEYYETGKINLLNFYKRRFARLFPALFFVLLFVYSMSNNKMEIWFALFYLTNITVSFWASFNKFLTHTWSLSCEEQFYIFWGLFLQIMLPRIEKKHIIEILIIICLSSWLTRVFLVDFRDVYNGIYMRFPDGISLGCLLAFLKDKIDTKKIRFLYHYLIFFVILFLFIADENSRFLYQYGIFVFNIIFSTLFIIILKEDVKKDFLRNGILVWIGEVSYGLYLWHFPIFTILYALGYNEVEILLFGSMLSLCIATASFYFIEKPILKLVNKIA